MAYKGHTWLIALVPADGRSVTLTARSGASGQKVGALQVNTWAKAPRAMRCLSWYMLLSNRNLQAQKPHEAVVLDSSLACCHGPSWAFAFCSHCLQTEAATMGRLAAVLRLSLDFFIERCRYIKVRLVFAS